MKIEEIIDYLRSKAEEGDQWSQTLSGYATTLERFKPMTITDDPETWPEDDEDLILFANMEGEMSLRKCGVVRHYIRRGYRGMKWQYLPEWEG